jgi:hypothetical protein
MQCKRFVFPAILVLFFLSACGLFSSSTRFFPRQVDLPGFLPDPIPSTLTPDPLPTQAEAERPPASPALSPQPTTTLLDDYMPGHLVAAETAHYVIYIQKDYFPVERQWWLGQVEQVYAYVSGRLQHANVKEKIHLGFLPPDPQSCPVRGLASHDHPPVVLIYASPASSRAYLLGVLAHETGHAISSEGFAEGMPGDLALAEGLATWASEKYWVNWMGAPSLDGMVGSYLARGEYESIRENYDLHGIYPWQNAGKDCLVRRDKIYSEWASFTGYLIDRYGWEKAHRLFRLPEPQRRDGKQISFPPNYEGVYGQSLNQLEEEWLREIKQRFPNPPEPVGQAPVKKLFWVFAEPYNLLTVLHLNPLAS